MKKSYFAATSYIMYQHKVLLIMHPKIGKWLPVGGKVEDGESPDETVLREIYEEVGLRVKNIKKSRTDGQKIDTIQYIQNEDLGSKYHVDFIFYSQANTSELKLENEIKEAKWFSYQDYIEIKEELFKDVREELENIFLTYLEYNPYNLISKKQINRVKEKKPLFIVVNHTDDKTLHFLNFLKHEFESEILFLNKTYSIDKNILKSIEKITYNKKVSSETEVISLLNGIFIEKEVIIFDLSAIMYNIIDKIENNSRITIIEDTKNGILYSNKQDATRFSIANSVFKKQIENPAVARSIFSSSLKYLRDRSIEIDRNAKILILGIGSIGLNLMHLFSKISHNTYGYDRDYSQLLLANIFNLKTIDNLENISEFDFIFGVTGEKVVLFKKDLELLKNNTYLVNCSSGKFEFESDFFKNRNVIVENNTEKVEVRENEFIFRTNLGYPINFYDNIGTDKNVINSVFAYMLDFVIELVLSKKKYELKDYDTDIINPELSDKYVRYYYKRFVK
jgi:8-oxo-dGTP pyrophosphatase MutT (NUDIX family)/S-adenosylhomocysteine hydrolase